MDNACELCNLFKQIATQKTFSKLNIDLNSLSCVIHQHGGYISFNYTSLNDDGYLVKRTSAVVFTLPQIVSDDEYSVFKYYASERLRKLLV